MVTTQNIIKLTQNQLEATHLIKQFVSSENDIFILNGAAGTGKTTVVKDIIGAVSDLVTNIILLAPTNRAVKVLSKKTGIIASTLHSEIYTIKEIKNKDGVIISTKLIPKYHFTSFDESESENLKTQHNLYIVDESSMISSTPNKDGVLISDNSLLEDFYKHVKHLTPNNKIVFVGDSYQLPPIGHNGIAPALNKLFLQEMLSKNIQEFELLEILRQESNSPILSLANDIKQKIDINCSTYSLKLANRFEGYSNFIKNFSELYDSNDSDQTIALGWTRKNVLQMNLDIRKHLYDGNPKVFEVGDLVYLNSKWSRGNTTVPKGEIGKVIAIIKDHGINGGMLFHTLQIEFTDHNNMTFVVESKVLSDYVYSDTEFIPKEMFIKLAIERSQKNKVFKNTGDSSQDEYMSAMQLKFAYALTVHKAQGGEWKNVFLHARTNRNDLRWNYTAITRASKNIYSFFN